MNKNVSLVAIVLGAVLVLLALVQHYAVKLQQPVHLSIYLGVLGIIVLLAGAGVFLMQRRAQ